MTERFRGIEESTIALALAVNPVDSMTGRPLRTEARVSVEEVDTTPILNPSGYWLFLTPPVELPPDPLTVTIDPSPAYVKRTDEIRMDEIDVPGVRIEIYPSSAYRFPRGATLIQGRVENEQQDAVAGAEIRIEHTDLTTRTDTDGSFVLVIEGIATTEFAEGNDALRVDPDGDNPTHVRDYGAPGVQDELTILVEHADFEDGMTHVEVEEGKRTLLDSPIVIEDS